MMIIDTKDEEEAKTFGKMVCAWEHDATQEYLRTRLYQAIRRGIEAAIAAGTLKQIPTENRIRNYVENHVEQILVVVAQKAPKAFAIAQAKLVTQVAYFVEREIIGKRTAGEKSKEITAMANKRFNEYLGFRRGREAGQRDAKQRKARAKPSATENQRKENAERILDAIAKIAEVDEIGAGRIYLKDVAGYIGVTPKTVSTWIKQSGKNWHDLIREGLKRKS